MGVTGKLSFGFALVLLLMLAAALLSFMDVSNVAVGIIAAVGVIAVAGFWMATMVAIASPMRRMSEAAVDMTRDGLDLNMRLPRADGDLGELAVAVNSLLDEISDTVDSIGDLAERVATASTQVARTATDISSSANRQATQAMEVATSMEEMTATVNEVAKNATRVAEQARRGTQLANDGADVVRKTIESMETIAGSVRTSSATVEELGRRSAEIGQIIAVISDIADQTNLLSLNAAIEAARAGEHGRGFAVVADEVRKLAEKTSKATSEVRETISSTQNETVDAVRSMRAGSSDVQTGVDLAGQAEHSLSDIVNSYVTVNNMVQQIAAAAEEQSTTAEEIAGHVESIADLAKDVTGGIDNVAHAAKDLSLLAERMNKQLRRLGR